MPRQAQVSRIHETEQLWAVALEQESPTQQLKVPPGDHLRPFLKRIGEQIGQRGVSLASHVASIAYRERRHHGDTYFHSIDDEAMITQ
jgi:hypothetical protein